MFTWDVQGGDETASQVGGCRSRGDDELGLGGGNADMGLGKRVQRQVWRYGLRCGSEVGKEDTTANLVKGRGCHRCRRWDI